MNITDLLSGSVISSIAESTGATEKDTASVLANALPTLVSAMASNASTKDGADSLAAALDHHTTSSGLSALLQNVDTEDGAKILGKILGGQNETVQNAVAKKSGASRLDTSKILAMAAPLLLSALGSQKKKTKTGAEGLSALLTGLLGGGEEDADDGSTLLSLAGSLLGGGSKSGSSSDVLTSLAGSLLGDMLTGGSGKKSTAKKTSSAKKTTAKKTSTAKKSTTAKKTTTAKKKSTTQNDDAAELLGSVLGSLLGGKK